MKRIVVSLLVLFATASCFAQPITRRAMDVNTVSDSRLQAEKNLLIPRYLDTTAANLSKGIDSCSAVIFTYDNNTQWIRACNPKRWVKAAGSLVADNTATVSISGDGSTATPLTADVNLSTTGQNAIVALADGLYVPNSVRNGLVWGGTVTWISGYTYNVSEAYYYINGSPFHSPTTTITLDPSDNDSSRIDVIAVNSQNLVAVIKGDPSDAPLEPTIDPETQLRLSIVLVQAGTTEPTNNGTGLRRECIYQENTEWTTASSSARINANSTNAPCVGSKDVEGTGVLNGDYVRFTRPSGNITLLDSFQVITFQLKSKANWGNNRKLILRWQSSGVNVGGVVNLSGTSYGWSSNLTGVCQTISIPLVDFGLPAGASVNQLLITASMPNGSIGFYLDQMCLQNQEQPSYATPITLQNGLNLDANTNIGELGGTLLHNTTNNTNYYVHTLYGNPVYDYPYQFQQGQNFGNGTGVTSFLSKGGVYPTSPDYNNAVRLGVNYTSDMYNNSPATEGYFGDRIGYMLNTNLRGHGSFGMYQDDYKAKNVGIFFHTRDNIYRDGVTIFAADSSNVSGNYSATELKNHKVAIFKTTGALQLPKYGAGTFTGTATYNLGVDASGNIIETTGGGGGGGGTDNANAGSGYRVLLPGTQQIKTLFNGYAIGIDSSSNTNGLTFKADTALLTTNAHLYKVVDSLPKGIAAVTADNGITANTTSNVRLGGTLLQNTTIATTGSYTLTVSGTSATTFQSNNTSASGTAIYGTTSGGGTAVIGEGTTSTGVGAVSSSGIGLFAQSSSGVAVWGSTSTGTTAGLLIANPATTNTTQSVLRLIRNTLGTAANNIAGSIEFQTEASLGSVFTSNELVSKWTNATDGSQTSQFEIWGTNSAVAARKLAIAGNGKLTLDGYGSGTQTGTAVYGLSVDASGNVIETASGGGGSITADNGLTANTSTNVRLGGTGLQNTTIDWGAFTFTHTFNSVAGNGLSLTSTSTAAASNLQKLLNISLSGANATTTQTTYASYITNTHTGTSATNVGGYFSASGGTNNYALIVPSGQVGIGTTAPVSGYLVDVRPPTGVTGIFTMADASATGLVAFNTSSGLAINAASSTGTAVRVTTNGSFHAMELYVSPATSGSVLPIIKLSRESTAAGSNGAGGSIDMYVKTSLAPQISNQIISKWTDATDATRTSQYIITGVNSGTTADKLTIDGLGWMKLNGITATAASALTAADGMIVYVNSTNGTFTTIGYWARENGVWVKW